MIKLLRNLFKIFRNKEKIEPKEIIISGKPQLKFMPDYCGSTVWSNDDFTNQKFGYSVNLKDLGISASTIDLSELVLELFWDRLNPVYQGLPSFWSGKMHIYFHKMIQDIYEKINSEIGKDYEIVNDAIWDMTVEHDIQKIDMEVAEMVNDPVSYFKAKGITYRDNATLIVQVRSEYSKWKIKEEDWLSRTY